MLVKKEGVLVPHDMNLELLDFILKDAAESRFVIGLFIPNASDCNFLYDTAHIRVANEELRIHSQRSSRHYQLHMYAWEHVYCLMPTAKAKRKKQNCGWLAPNIEEILATPDFPTTWYSNDIAEFAEGIRNASA